MISTCRRAGLSNMAVVPPNQDLPPPHPKTVESLPLYKNDDSVKKAPAYCRSFLDGLHIKCEVGGAYLIIFLMFCTHL